MDLPVLEARTRNFYDWELRGRGWKDYGEHVALEPPFVPFLGHERVARPMVDDGRRPTFLSRMWEGLTAPTMATRTGAVAWPEPDPFRIDVGPCDELELLVPAEKGIGTGESATWIRSISATCGRLAFEAFGSAGRVFLRLAASSEDLSIARRQLRGLVPAATVRAAEQSLLDLYMSIEADAVGCLEFGLGREFMLPLRNLPSNPDPLSAIVAALSEASRNELLLFQVLFEQVQNEWANNAFCAVRTPDGEPFFLDAPFITTLAEEKFASPLFAVAVRVLSRGRTVGRASELIRGLAGALNQYGDPNRNALVPLAGDSESLISDILIRANRRAGMLLSLDELVSLARLPSESLRNPALVRADEPLETLPAEVRGEGVALGEARHLKESTLVRVAVEARVQHTYVIGASGTGKSTLLVSLAIQDIEAGRGVGVVDPHGDLIDDILARIPAHRSDDVILFDPADPDWSTGWNILGAHSDIEKELLASDLAAVFRRLSTSWGDQMTTVLANAVLAFLESSKGGTLTELRRFLLDDDFRASFLTSIRDDHVRSFWRDEFPLLIGKKPQAPILTRLDTFLRSKLVRAVVTEREKPLNFRSIIDDQKIFLARLSQGAIGEENAALLGSLLVSKFHQVSLSRQDIAESERQPFFLYIDEFHHMATPSMAGLFSGVRKYRLGLTIAHQDSYQLRSFAPEVERAALTNAYTRVMFRVSDEDAKRLEKGVEGFTAEDFTRLGRGQAICRVGRRDHAFRIKTIPLGDLPRELAEVRCRTLRHQSGVRYGRRRGEPASTPAQDESGLQVQRNALGHALGSGSVVGAQQQRPKAAETLLAKVSGTQDSHQPVSRTDTSVPGRGGPIHKYLQGLIREAGHAAGFKSTIEHQFESGKRVDVLLSRSDLSVACEIANASTVERELANIDKCLGEKCSLVCSVSLDAGLLQAAEEAVAEWPEEKRTRLRFFSPEELFAFLNAQPTPTETIAGYSVRVRHSGTHSKEMGTRQVIADVMLKSIRRLKGRANEDR